MCILRHLIGRLNFLQFSLARSITAPRHGAKHFDGVSSLLVTLASPLRIWAPHATTHTPALSPSAVHCFPSSCPSSLINFHVLHRSIVTWDGRRRPRPAGFTRKLFLHFEIMIIFGSPGFSKERMLSVTVWELLCLWSSRYPEYVAVGLRSFLWLSGFVLRTCNTPGQMFLPPHASGQMVSGHNLCR